MTILQSCDMELGEFFGSLIFSYKEYSHKKYGYINLHLIPKEIGKGVRYHRVLGLYALNDYLND